MSSKNALVSFVTRHTSSLFTSFHYFITSACHYVSNMLCYSVYCGDTSVMVLFTWVFILVAQNNDVNFKVARVDAKEIFTQTYSQVTFIRFCGIVSLIMKIRYGTEFRIILYYERIWENSIGQPASCSYTFFTIFFFFLMRSVEQPERLCEKVKFYAWPQGSHHGGSEGGK